jgi:hypothetical protein
VALAGLALAAGPGCVPGVAWLPDSSGFIYSGGNNFQQIVHFDLASNKKHVLVADTKAPTMWPAVSPDGRRIAVARRTGEKKEASTLQVLLYDRRGKEVQRSKVFDWRKPIAGNFLGPRGGVQLFWSPDGGQLLIGADNTTGIYHLKKDHLIKFEDTILETFGNAPVRPDGKGFLVLAGQKPAATGKKAPPQFLFVDWKGGTTPIKTPPDLFQERSKDPHRMLMWLAPGLYASRWQGNTAVVTSPSLRGRIDTGKGVALLEPVKPELTAEGRPVLRRFKFAASGAEIRIVDHFKPNETRKLNDLFRARVEVVKANEKGPQVLAEDVGICTLLPAPNGKLAALRYVLGKPPKDQRDLIVILNPRGEAVARIDASEK